jgi:hypothetical protein
MTILTKIKKEAFMNFDNQLKTLGKNLIHEHEAFVTKES